MLDMDKGHLSILVLMFGVQLPVEIKAASNVRTLKNSSEHGMVLNANVIYV